MTEFAIHMVPGSPFGRAVLATLEEKGAGYRIRPVRPEELHAGPHLSRHPFGRIPVLEHGDFRLYETQAILRYVDRVLPTPALTPADVRAAGRMDQLMNINDWYLFRGVGDVIGFQRVVAPMVLGLSTDEAAVAAAMPAAERVFQVLSDFLGDQTYMAGEEVSLADLLVGCQLDLLSTTPEWAPLTAGRENLIRWLSRVTARPSFQATTWPKVAALAQAA